MLRNIAGIMADEEPKTAISASGLYNSSDLSGGSNFSMSDVILKGLSEFTYMAWFYLNPQDDNSFTVVGYVEKSPISVPILLEDDNIRLSMRNENGGTTSCIHNQAPPLNQWVHFCSTGSVSNGRCRIYVNGVLVQSAVMTYANSTDATTSYIADANGFDDVSMSQLNIFNRELTEAEVAKHYVYDQDLMQSGVLGWDAMTPAQRSGLIYSSSYTDDISISGNEFNDKSGNGITISPQPSLTGEQIYFYTNASDLPSDTQIYPLSTLNVAGAGSVYTSNSSFSMADLKANGFSWMFYVDFSDAGKQVRLGGIRGDSDAITTSDFTILKLAGGDIIYVEAYNGSSYSQWAQSGTAVSGNGLTHVALSYTGTSGTNTLKLYIDGVEEASVGAPSWTVGEGGRISHGGADFGGGSFTEAPTGTFGTPFLFDRAITQAEILSISSGGTSLCYDLVDNTAGLKDAIIYAPTLGEYNGSSGQALIDPASGITTNESGTVTYDGTGVSVECTPSNTTVYDVNSIDWTDATGNNNRYTKTPIAPASTSFAVSTWATLESLGTYYNYYLTNYNTSSVCFSVYHEGVNDFLHVYNGTDFAIATSTSPANTWFHIVADFVGGSYLRLYINGVQVAENTSVITSLPTGGTENCGIGYNPNVANLLKGSMFQCIEFKNHGGLSQTEVNELYAKKCFEDYSTGLVNKMSSGYYLGNFNGNDGIEALDQVGSDDLSAGGPMIFADQGLQVECTPSDTTVYDVNSATLDGSSQYFDAGNVSALQVSGSISFGCRFKPDIGHTSFSYFMGKTGPQLAEGAYAILYNYPSTGDISVNLYHGAGAQTILTSLVTYPTGTEYSVIANYDGTTLSLYVDGVLDNSATATGGAIANTDEPFIIGGDSITLGTNLFKGSIRSVFLADRDLTTNEISLLSSDPAKCFGLMPSISDINYFVSLSNYNGNTGQELSNQGTGSVTTTNVGSTPFTDQGLQVDCAPSDTSTFAVNSAELNGTSQYFQSDDSTALNPNLSTLTVATWVYLEGTSYPMLYTKTDGGSKRININVNINNKLEAYARIAGVQREYEFAHAMSNGWNHIVYNFTRASANDMGQLIVNGVDVGTVGTWKYQDLDWSTANLNYFGAVEIARLNIAGGPYYFSQSQAFTGYAIGNTLSLSEAQYLYNNGDAKCWDDVNSEDATLYAKFDEVWDLSTFNGSTEAHALQGKKGLTDFVNIGSTPFTDQGLTVECTS